jgi:hypothetical protein
MFPVMFAVEHAPKSEVAGGVDEAGGEGQHQKCSRQRVPHALGGALQPFLVEAR